MQDASVVRSLERVHNRVEDLEDAIERQAFAPLLEVLEPPLEVLAFEQLHHEARRSARRPTQIEHCHGVRTGECDHDLLLPRQTFHELGILRVGGSEQLDRNELPALAITSAADQRLATLSDDIHDLVTVGDEGAGKSGHGRRES